ncbi:MAG: hypothetical protein C0478_06055 [Planctomyces sp.]|nr:hypothetical protein [Planctomyces sp.]
MAIRPKKKPRLKPPRRTRSHLVKWGRSLRERGAHSLVVGLAQFVAHIGEDLASIQNAITDGAFQQMGRIESPESWESMYLRPDRLFQFLGNHAADSPGDEADGIALGDVARWYAISSRVVDRMSQEKWAANINELFNDCDFQLAMMEFRGFVSHCVRSFEEMLESGTLNDFSFVGDELFFSQQAQFLVKVFWPSICEHGETPNSLYRRARLGNVSAIEKLVAIDLRILRIPIIAELVEDWRATGDVQKYSLIAKAMSNLPRKRASPRNEKIRALSLVWGVGRLLALPDRAGPSIEELRGAFDAAAKDRGLAADPHLPAGEEALRKGVSRMSKKLPADLWDMFGRKAVP